MTRTSFRLLALLPTLWLAGCGGEMGDLRAYISEVQSRPGGWIEPLPEIKPYETFAYQVQNMRSPFEPDVPTAGPTGPGDGVRPDRNRNREFLEQFPLDTLRMVGTLELEGKNYGLVQTNDGLIHRVQPGNYMGQNDGRIVVINQSEIEIVEIVPDGIGGYIERPAAVALSD